MSYLIAPKGFSGAIDYQMPKNVEPSWAHLFPEDRKYLSVELGVRELRNVFVNHYGLVINNGLLVRGCAPNIGADAYDHGFYFTHWKKAMEQMLVSRFGKSIPSRNLDDERKYLIVHSPWFSYYFWVTECIPRLLSVRDQLKDLVLIYPEGWDRFPFVKDTLSLFPELQVERIERDIHLRVRNLIMPEVKPWTPMFIPEQVLAVRNLILDAADARGVKSPVSGNIHLSRMDAPRKNFENSREVSAVLDEFGYHHITMTGRSIFDQAVIMRSADRLVSITGAGMSNFTFIKEKASILDVTNAGYLTNDKYKFHFWKLACILGAEYRVLFCPHANNPEVPRFSLQNLIVETDSLRALLESMQKEF